MTHTFIFVCKHVCIYLCESNIEKRANEYENCVLCSFCVCIFLLTEVIKIKFSRQRGLSFTTILKRKLKLKTVLEFLQDFKFYCYKKCMVFTGKVPRT